MNTTSRALVNTGLLTASFVMADTALWNSTVDGLNQYSEHGATYAALGLGVTLLAGLRYILKPASVWFYGKKEGKHSSVGTVGLTALTLGLIPLVPGVNCQGTAHASEMSSSENKALYTYPSETSLDSIVDKVHLESRAAENGERVMREGIETAAVSRESHSSLESSSFSISPEYKALLDTIAFAEGADYDKIYGGEHFSDFSHHPRRAVSKWGMTSTAAGRYQFLSSTYDRLKKKGKFQDGFTPEEQDKAAVYLVQRCGVSQEMLHDAVQKGDFREVWGKLSGQWASLPHASTGKSVYGQRTEEKLKEAFLGFYVQAQIR